ncbi:MAG: SdiA-regulated domain-containing protein [Chitinophagaceae bacterium]
MYYQCLNTLVIAFFFMIFASCNNSSGKKTEEVHATANGKEGAGNFNFTKPIAKWVLPDQLKEISGIVKLDSNQIMAIEDLHAALYVLNLDDGKATIANTIPFYETAKEKIDIEDLAIVGDTVYALWSHGSLFKINDWKNAKQVTEIKTDLGKENNTEGLAYDPVTGNLLIACKNKSGEEDEKKSTRSVFEYDIKKGTLKTDPFLLIEKKDLKKMSGDDIKFYPSAIAVHPVTHDVYVLSSKDSKCIAQFTHDGKLIGFDYLNKDLLLQPEGLCFDAEGNLYISTEGKNGASPYIYEFSTKK